MLLKRLFEATRRTRVGQREPATPRVDFPLDEERRLYEAHGRAPVDRHLDILFGDYRIGNERFIDMYREAMRATGTVVTPFNVFQRFDTRAQLCRYLLDTLEVPGCRAECGAYRGATALLLCRAMRSRQATFEGQGMHLIDSFSGTSRNVAQDLIAVRDGEGDPRMAEFFEAGKTDASEAEVRATFAAEFPGAAVHAGWIPEVLASLPESSWAFVHLDVTLYEPTLAALAYFHPRLSPGGVILCDGSIFCPGAEAAFRTYCERNALGYAVFGHREYVLVNEAR
ncbi:MAG: TylF/MycF/NovP-related O-methyltransferase [Burkholderiales bacterium]